MDFLLRNACFSQLFDVVLVFVDGNVAALCFPELALSLVTSTSDIMEKSLFQPLCTYIRVSGVPAGPQNVEKEHNVVILWIVKTLQTGSERAIHNPGILLRNMKPLLG